MVGLELAKFYSELGQVSNAFFIILINILLVNTRNVRKFFTHLLLLVTLEKKETS